MVEISPAQAEALAETFLVTINNVYEACVASQRRRDVGPDAPLSLECDLVRSDNEDVEDLHHRGREAASRAEVAAGHSLAAMLRLLRHPSDAGPATSALFTLARASIEGAAIAHYLHDPAATLNQRLLRTAQILVWSERNRLVFMEEFSRTNPSSAPSSKTDSWTALTTLLDNVAIVQAGRNDKKPWEKLTRGDDSVGKFEIFALMKDISADTPLLYRTLSGVAHHAPWITEFHMRPTQSDQNGTYYGTQTSQAQQVDLVANVCHALMTAATTKALFYGAGTDQLAETTKTSLNFFVSLADTILAMDTATDVRRSVQSRRTIGPSVSRAITTSTAAACSSICRRARSIMVLTYRRPTTWDRDSTGDAGPAEESTVRRA